MKYHPYHLVSPSPWPVYAAFSTLVFTASTVCWFHNYKNGDIMVLIGLLLLLTSMIVWWRDVVREATFEGFHTHPVQRGLTIGFLLFIASEVMLFFAFFWAYFHSSLSPSVELGALWPPTGVDVLNPWHVPLLNTIILLSSGATITWAHHSLISGRSRSETILALGLTVFLGLIFTLLQAFEYYEAPFTIADSVFGSTFYATTGLHGLHVIIGTIFLIVCFIRLIQYHLSSVHHLGFEAGILYWHFLDYAWLLIFLCFYVWPW